MPSFCRIEWGNAYQTMHTVLGLEIAIRVAPRDFESGALDPRFFARLEVEYFVSIPVRLGPPNVHPQQHVRPVLRLRAPGARVNGHQRICGIHLATQQRFELEMLNFQGQFCSLYLDFLEHLRVVCLFYQIEQTEGLLNLTTQLLPAVHWDLQLRPSFQYLLSFFKLLPEFITRHLRLESDDFCLHLGEIKDDLGAPQA